MKSLTTGKLSDTPPSTLLCCHRGELGGVDMMCPLTVVLAVLYHL